MSDSTPLNCGADVTRDGYPCTYCLDNDKNCSCACHNPNADQTGQDIDAPSLSARA